MGFELGEKRAEIPSASSLGPTFGPLRAIGSGTTIWSEGACALPLQWSLPRPRKPRPSPEKARFLFLLAPYANRAQAMCPGDASCGLRLGVSPPARCRLINADETTLSAFLPPEIVRAAVRGGRPRQVGLSFLAKTADKRLCKVRYNGHAPPLAGKLCAEPRTKLNGGTCTLCASAALLPADRCASP